MADPAHDPAWTALFAKLSASKTRQSQFEERRYFPFRSTPVVLKGEIRIAPERGLSLRYLEPDRRILIVDDKGALMRDDEGRERAAPSDSRAQAVTAALVNVLRFDLPALQKSFVMYGRHEGSALGTRLCAARPRARRNDRYAVCQWRPDPARPDRNDAEPPRNALRS